MTAPTKHLLSTFASCHLAQLGVPAVLSGGRDAKILADLWRQFPADVERLMPYFMQDRDPWVRARGFTVPMYRHRFAALLLKHKAPSVAAETDWWAECQQHCGGRCGSRVKHALFGKQA